MSFEFPKVSLKQISSKIGDGIHGTPIYDENGSYYFINGNNLGSGRIVITSSTKKVSRDEYLKHKKELNESTVLLSINGTIGNVALYDNEPIILGKSACYINILPDANANYIGYVLKDRLFQHYIKQQANGSTIKNVSLKLIRDYEFTLPPKFVQDRIAEILSSLDKKISVNGNMSVILEQMAQALFKSWFVDFDPVKAKMAALEAGGSQEDATLAAMTVISGKDADALAVFEREHPTQYAELKATAELFPSAMQESELGEIPVGWFVGDLSNIALLNTESWSKKNAPESVSYVDLANTKWGVINSVEVYKFSDAPSRARRILRPCDTIVGTVRPGNGSYSYISKPGLTGSTGFAVLTPKARIFSEYIYLCVTSNESIERLAHLADGGAYPAVNADVVLSTQCVLPIESETKEALLKVFSSRTEVFFSYRANNLDVNEVLTSIRDTLLPKLLSGEITLPEAEQIISEEA
ncbi:restriction endonuclease subunit S [Salmonella enterica]|uniref:restriction endonuclease subunit S n=1 Tax=Salmonella enterica TaxID=28901 RepID=UPI0033150F93